MLSSSPKRADLNKLLRIDQACLQSYDRKDEIAIGIHSGSRISLVREKYKPCTEQTKARTLTLSERRMRLCPTKGLLGGPKLASGRLLPVNALLTCDSRQTNARNAKLAFGWDLSMLTESSA